ncbi:MAG TPA: class I SAM-dependent methyltransferase [Ferruginibacter sp.]|nr:class I SAM-dependent methyltransferase [Chitinophagaceae bacterium]HQW92110.1 class I SAM-dependent methyltransferase [Ferruginibacter sp.]
MDNYQSYFEANKQSWNKRTAVHKDSAFYDLASFKKGKSSLNKIELEELGSVKGKSLLHLQCHFGMDTMSWQREGAHCVGVDLSDEAIKLAKEINEELKLKTEFICANIYDLKSALKVSPTGGDLEGAFDIVFTSYGTIGWLPDLDKWAGIVAHFLKPGGIFYIADFHPVLWMMDDSFEKIKYHYFNTDVISEEISGTYSDRDAPIKSIEHGWNHPFSEIFNALVKHGLQILQFNEFPYSPYNCFKNLEQGTDGMWRIRGMDEKMPVMYSIKAVKQF